MRIVTNATSSSVAYLGTCPRTAS